MIWCTTNLHSLKLQKIFFFLFSIFLPILLIEAAAAHLSDPKKITKEKLSIVSISDWFISIFYLYSVPTWTQFKAFLLLIKFPVSFLKTLSHQRCKRISSVENWKNCLQNYTMEAKVEVWWARKTEIKDSHTSSKIFILIYFFFVNTWVPPGTGVWITSDRVGFHHSAGKRSGYGAVGVLPLLSPPQCSGSPH